MTICVKSGLIKRISLYKMSFYPEQGNHSKNKITFELDFLIFQQNLK